MKLHLVLRLTSLSLFTFLQLNCATNNYEKNKQQLLIEFQEMGKAIVDNDLKKFTSHYVNTPLHLPPGAPLNHSKEKIEDFLSDKLGLYIIDKEPEITFSDDASMAYVYGEYYIKANPLKDIEFVEGRFITIWKRIEGKWKCVVDIWNSPDAKFEHL